VFDFLWGAQKWAEKPIVQGWENKRNTYFLDIQRLVHLVKINGKHIFHLLHSFWKCSDRANQILYLVNDRQHYPLPATSPSGRPYWLQCMAFVDCRILTVEPPVVTTSRKRPLSDQFSKIPKVFKSDQSIRSVRSATTSHKRPRPLLELKVWNFLLFLTSRKRPLDR